MEPTREELDAAREQMLAAFGGARADTERAWPRAREKRLVRRILQRTTREDPGWRGDVQLVAGFVRQRLGASRALRWVAASLLAHAVALPVCAFFAGDDGPERGAFSTGIEPRLDPFPAQVADSAAPATDEIPLERGTSLDADGSPAAPPIERIHNALQRDRFWLQHEGARPQLDVEAGAALKIRLLAARSPGATGDEGWLDDENGFAEAGPLEQVLWTEVLLDRFVLERDRSRLLGRALGTLASHAAAGEDEALVRLREACLERARAYGLWEAVAGFDPEAVPAPLSAAWRADLARAWSRVTGGEGLPGPWGVSPMKND